MSKHGKTRHKCINIQSFFLKGMVVSFSVKCRAKGNDFGFYSFSVMWKVCHGSKQEEDVCWKRGGWGNCLEGKQRDSTTNKHNPLDSVPCSAELKGWLCWGIWCLPNCGSYWKEWYSVCFSGSCQIKAGVLFQWSFQVLSFVHLPSA